MDGRKPLPRELSLYFDARHLMDPGALGCYASHIKAWEQVIRKALPYALVLEDDAILPPGLGRALTHIVAALPKGWDMVHLGTEPDRAVCEIAKVGNRRIVQFSRVPPGAVGYLISHAGAKKLLQAEPRVWPIDTDTRRPWVFGLAVYGVVSPPIRHNWSILSTIRARVQAAHVAPWIACRIRQPDPQFGRVLVQLGAAGTGAMVALPDRQQRLEDPRRSQARQLKQFRDQSACARNMGRRQF